MIESNAIGNALRSVTGLLGNGRCALLSLVDSLAFLARSYVSTRVLRALMCAWFASLVCTTSLAEGTYREQMRGLDEQVQQIKSDVLGIDAELNRLEEKLLYPSNTQLALFVAIPKGDAIRLDSVQVQIDGQPVARYIYSFKELEALQKGGVQRIYTGNVATGAHQLDVNVIAKLDGKDYTPAGHFTITKGIAPKLVGITVAGSSSSKSAIDIGEW
jgi:hypothetical protein